MAKKAKKGKNRLDKFYHLAKEQGYRSRAAFKLIQLNRKYNFLGKCRAVLDLCAAPGGWLQVAAKTMPVGSLILGVDLAPIKPIRGVKTLVQDITTQQCRTAIKREAGGARMDVVLHDGAPNVGGAWASEAYSQSTLVLDALKLAVDTLAPKGTFVTKIFRSKDYNALLYAFNQLFEKVEATKPAASRNASAEIFVVCLGYKAPAKIDPRLLDPKVLFQEVVEAKKVMGPEALLRQKIKQRRFREGYEEGVTTLRRFTSALAFLVSDTPVEMLGSYTELALDGPNSWAPVEALGEGAAEPKELAAKIRSHEATTAEIRTLCKDLQVLGRSDFKQLLRWRLTVRKALKADLSTEEDAAKGSHKKGAKAADGKAQAGADGAAAAADPEEALLADMAALKDKMAREAKRDKKKRREMKIKSRLRAAQAAQSEGLTDDPHQGGPDQLFNLTGVEARLGDADIPDDELLENLDSDEEESDAGVSDGEEGSDTDSELAYELELEDALEHSYKEYLERKGVRAAAEKERRKRLGMDGELGDEDDEDGAAADDSGDEDDVERLSDGDDDEDGDKAGGLLVSLDEDRAGVAKSASAMAAQWFKQDLFADPNLLDDDEEEEQQQKDRKAANGAASAKDGRPAKKARMEADAGTGKGKAAKGKQQQQEDGTEDEEDDDEEPSDAARARSGLTAGTSSQQPARGRRGRDEFEVVPQEASGSGSDSGTDSEDEFDMLDDQGKAEVLALAKRMLRRKEKESIVDAAYNRFAFHDSGLPRWFAEDERRFMRPIPPVTKAEVEEEKQRLRAIDARPIKKIAEAKARKKQKLVKRLDQARQKANAVADQEDVPMKSKMREIEKIYAKAQSTGKGKKGKGKRGDKRKGPPLDNRMKKDKKSMMRAKQKQMKKKGRKGR
ncbi:hypothetical protein Agub_g5000 [Astrephomene gubernaculifera]|uniref:Putative rRNA methyltransferase n=1 Tax=Astrephomene gubernaculifera TaxID=47775 RepID=A0AAD3DL63_9CHLO|nr:hypothetical protein Agub_g5000 [Astrephomene gubernaculifera]